LALVPFALLLNAPETASMFFSEENTEETFISAHVQADRPWPATIRGDQK
jgi:hypothetical protein